MPSSSPAASRSRRRREARDHVVDRRHQRVGVGAVDPAPDGGVRARHAGDVAERRAGRGQPLALRATAPARPAPPARWRARAAGGRRTPSRRRACRARSPTATRPIRVISRCSRSYAVPRVSGVGVRYQVASANRSARACSTPAVSAPASGWPPMKRGSSTAPTHGALDRADVGHDAVRPGGRQHLADRRRQHLDRRGHEREVGVRDRRLDGVERLEHRAAGDRRLARSRRRVVAAHVRAEALASGQADRAADQPDTDDGDLHAAALRTLPATAAARSTCSR